MFSNVTVIGGILVAYCSKEQARQYRQSIQIQKDVNKRERKYKTEIEQFVPGNDILTSAMNNLVF